MKRIRRILLSRVSKASVSIILTVVLTVTSFPSKAFAQPTSPPSATYDVAALLIGSSHVIISWNASQSTAASGFRIERTATDPSFVTGVVRFTVGSTSNSYTDKTVIGGYAYLYRVIAFNELGDSPASNTAIVTIPSPAPNPANQVKPTLGTDQVSILSESSVVLGGSLSDLGTAGQCLVYFEWGVDTNYGNIADPKVVSTTGAFSVTLRNLRPATTYHYRTVAVGKGAGTVFGVDRTFTTYPAATVSDSLPSIIPGASLRVGQSATNRANAAADNLLISPDSKIKLTIPKGALAKDADIEMTQYVPSRVSGIQVISQFSLQATDVETLASIKQFGKELQINIIHTDSDLKGIDTRSLHLYYFNDTQNTWVPVQSSYEPKTKTLTATVNHFTTFGEMANPLKSGPGMITAFQNDLQTGAATGAYPIEVPPGPGGFQPKISLQYNSGAVDEMKNKRDVGSWIGIGWSLSLGSISYDEVNNRYSLELNGTSYTLVGSTDNTSYYTLPESFLKVMRSGNQWNVWDKGGNYYRFGGTSDSQQYHDSNIYYRWDLSRMQGVASNLTFIDIAYIQDTWYGTIRSAYPSVLKYTDGSGNDTVKISFNSSYDYTGADGNMRFDTPNGTAQNPAPPIVENKKLDSIEVRVLVSGTWQLIRKYYFTYAYSNSYYSADYGGIYYSGNYTLSSITQKDSTDNLSLPATTFAYEGKQTYLNDNTAVSYNGNPGNPASFNWPHLTIINNGYGANVTYGYTQIPSTSVANMWTREVVSSKSISSGIGPSENRTYTYTGYPQYLVSDGDWWNAKFRGFSQVQDTDAAGNYVIHYFNTVDANDGDALKLTGLETKTEWYSSNGTMFRKVENQWGWSDSINQGYDLIRQWGATAQLASPESVAVTSNGTVYVADSSNHRVQTFNATGSLIMMWGSYGTGNGQFKGPDGIAVGNDTYVYVADTANNRIQKFATNGTFVSTWGSYGSGNGQFNTPLGVAADNNSNVYVVDTYNNRVQKFTANGTYVTQWGSYGSGNGQFNYPYQAAVDSSGNVYIADASNSRIQKFTSNGTFIFSIGSYGSGNGQFIGVTGVAVDKNGNIYGSDNNGNRIEKFDSNGNFLTAWGSGGSGNGQFNHPYGLAADNSSNIYVAEYGNNRVQKFDSSGNFITKWGTVQGSGQLLNSPEGLAVSPGGTVYSVDTYADRIMKFTVNGTFSGTWGNYGPTSGSFIFPYGGAVGPDGSVYIADQGNNRVQKFNSSGGFLAQWGSNGTGNGQFISPRGIAVDNSSNVYVVDWGNNRIQKFNSSGGYVTQWGSNGSANGSFNGPFGIAAGLDGYIYVADSGNSRVQKFTNNGTFVFAWGTNGTSSEQFNNAQGIAADNSSNIYVADTYNSRVQKFTSNGTFVTSWGLPGDSGNYLNYPIGISVGNDGYVYVTSGNIIKKFVRDYSVHLDQVTETTGSKVSQTRYAYDTYGNIVTEYHEGDTSNATDNYTIWRAFYPNTATNILSKPARERVYAGTVTTDNGGSNLKAETIFYYDNNNATYNTPPTKGLVTRVERRNAPSSAGLVAYLPLDEGNGNTTADLSLNGHTGTLTNSPLWTTGKYGNALQFDGVNDYVEVAQPSAFAFGNGNFTISMWFKRASTNRVDNLIAIWTPSQNKANCEIYFGDPTSNNQLKTRLTTNNGSWRVWSSGTAITDSNWHQITFIYTSNYTYRFFIDGNLTSTTYDPGYSLDPAAQYVRIGGRGPEDYSGSFNGSIDEVKVWNRALTTAEVQNSYTGTSTYYTFDSYGNKVSEQDANGQATLTSYDSVYHTYPTGKTYAITGLTENYTYDAGTFNMLTLTDVNGQIRTYSYDAFKRLISVNKPLGQNPDTQYEYNNWGNITQQNIKTKTWVDNSTYLWQTQYFDGLGRVVQVQSNGETNYTIVSSTVTYNARGLVDKEYVMQNILSSNLSGYKSPEASWKYVTYSYDDLGRVTQKINADSTWVSYNFTTPWQSTVTNEIGNITTYFYDAYSRLVNVQEPGTGSPVTNYSYDILGNLINVTDATGNATTINYDWLSRKTSMIDPDMGGWTYGYDNNGNLVIQTDNKSQSITFAYDALNRLTGKTYPSGANMTNVGYSYDSGSYGKSQRTGMTDASGNTSYVYDQRGRLITENRTFNGDNISYVTRYGYDGTDRLMWIIYPTGENVSQTYNGRGLPYTVSGNVAGNLVTSTYYSALGQITETNFNNSLRTTFGYWGTNGTYDNTGGYYGRLWEIKTLPQAGGIALLDIKHTWDAGGNLATRQDVLLSQTETFTYDTLDRLTGVTGPYSLNYTYNAIGNIRSKNGVSYVYGSNKPHALTFDGSSNYTYDNNGNMLTRGSQNITWDAENRPVSIAFATANGTNWWDTSWTMRQKLTFNMTSVSSNLSNFPVLVHLTSSNFNFGYAKSNGGDLRFIDADNTTVLNYEIEKWTSSEAWVWVKIPSLTGNSSSGYVWMYYDNPGAADGGNPPGVWDTNYLMVQHLKETTIDGTAGQIKDSTQNGNNGTSHGLSSSAQVAGKINGSFSFAGNGDYVSVPDNNAWAFGNFTLSVWVNANSWSGSSWTRAFIGQDAGGGETNKWFFSYNGATTFMVNTAGDNNGGTYINGNAWTPQTGVWYHLSVTRSGNNFTFYRDGTTDGTPTNNHAIPNVAAPLTIAWAEGANSFNGIIDEVQISNTARSADWMKASHLSDTDTLITFGSSESVSVSASNVSFVYDGDGNRVKKTENGETILYVNKYYEKNLTTGNVTTYYFSGGRTAAERIGSTLRYMYQDSLSSTSLMTDSSGNSLGTVNYYPFGSVRSGTVPTDVLFKGQKLDDTGLYYSGAGYYDSNIGSFISPHTHAKNPNNPQSLNSYFSNSPAKLFSRAGKVYQPPALAPVLAVPVQTPPAQAIAEQAMAEPEQAPVAEEPGQTSPVEPTVPSSGGYHYQALSAATATWNAFYGMVVEFGPKGITAWRPNLISDLTAGAFGGIRVTELTVSGRIIVEDGDGGSFVSLSLIGSARYNLAGDLKTSVDIWLSSARVVYDTTAGEFGEVGLGNPIDLKVGGSTPRDFFISLGSGPQYIPRMSDIRFMAVDVRFTTVQTFSSFSTSIEEGAAFLRPAGFRVVIFQGPPAFRAR